MVPWETSTTRGGLSTSKNPKPPKLIAGQQAYGKEQQGALELAQNVVQRLLEMVQTGDAQAFMNLIGEYAGQKKQIEKLTSRINLQLNLCPRCGSGDLMINLNAGHGENISITEIGRQEMNAQFAHGVQTLERGA